MEDLRRSILKLLRNNSRSSLSAFSRTQDVPVKKTHYEYKKIKKDKITKLVPVMNFEALGFVRVILIFHDVIKGLEIVSKFKAFYVNNSVRLDTALLVEYLFFFEEERKTFIKELKRKNISFDYYLVEEVIKQEDFCFN